jgi:hypothetical protein
MEGAKEGFKHHITSPLTGFHYKHNYKSALVDAERVSVAIKKRIHAGKTIGPFAWDKSLPFGLNTLCVNPMGSLPYKHEPHRARCIDDPIINEVIDPPPFCMPTFGLLRAFSTPGCWYGLQDVESAFLCLPIHYDMWQFFAFAWADVTSNHPSAAALRKTAQDFLYFHTHGLFGGRDMPFIFTMYMLFVTMVATALGMGLAPPYIDDVPHVYDRRSETQWAMDRYADLLDELGSPEKESKRTLAFQKGSILGREFNSRAFTVGVPADKWQRFQSRLRRCFGPGPRSRRIPVTELDSLLGEAAFMATVLPVIFSNLVSPLLDMGRDANIAAMRRSQRARWTVRVTPLAARAGRELLARFPHFNRKVSINTALSHPWASPVYTDASGGNKAGWGVASKHTFRAGLFTRSQRKACIAYLELLAVLYAVEDHAALWTCQRVPFYIDNTVALAWVTYGRVRSCTASHKLRNRVDLVLRRICELSLFYNFELHPIYIRSADNVMADALSRQDWLRFTNTYTTHVWDAPHQREHTG